MPREPPLDDDEPRELLPDDDDPRELPDDELLLGRDEPLDEDGRDGGLYEPPDGRDGGL